MRHALERAKDDENSIVHPVLVRRDLLHSAFLPIRLYCWQGFRTAAEVRRSEGIRQRGPKSSSVRLWRNCQGSNGQAGGSVRPCSFWPDSTPIPVPLAITIEDERPASVSLVLLFSIPPFGYPREVRGTRACMARYAGCGRLQTRRFGRSTFDINSILTEASQPANKTRVQIHAWKMDYVPQDRLGDA